MAPILLVWIVAAFYWESKQFMDSCNDFGVKKGIGIFLSDTFNSLDTLSLGLTVATVFAAIAEHDSYAVNTTLRAPILHAFSLSSCGLGRCAAC